MSAVREDSLMFSLEEIFEQQRDRVEQDRRRQAETDRRLREQQQAETRAARDAELRRERERLDAQRLREREYADQQARLVALREATLARTKAEVAARNELAAQAQLQRHEQAMAAICADSRLTRTRWFALALAITTLLSAGIGILWAAESDNQHTQAQAALSQQLEASRSTVSELEADLSRTQELSLELRQQVADLRRQLGALREDAGSGSGGQSNRPRSPAAVSATNRKPPVPRTPAPAKPCLDDGDPLNPCL